MFWTKFRSAATVLLVAHAGLAMASPVTGSSAGIFANAITQTSAVLTGLGTNSFSWGTPFVAGTNPNSLTFNGVGFSTPVGTAFDVGTITYFNGATVLGTGADGVTLSVTLTFTNPAGVVQNFDYALMIVSTPNDSGTPEGDADRIDFNTAAPQTFLLDGQLVSLALEVGLTGVNGFSSKSSFSVFENFSETATLRGVLRAPNSVPEPSSLALLAAAGVAGLLTRRRLRT